MVTNRTPDEFENSYKNLLCRYRLLDFFVTAVTALKQGNLHLDKLNKGGFPTIQNTIATTAILEAGRRSLDQRRAVEIFPCEGQWGLK